MFGDVNINPIEHGVNKPIISIIEGNVNGAGLWLVLASDIRGGHSGGLLWAGERCASTSRWNSPACSPSTCLFHWPRRCFSPPSRFGAGRFYDLGILNAVVDKEKLAPTAQAYAKAVCAGGPLAVKAMKELLQKGHDLDYGAILSLTGDLITPVVNSQDTMEGIQAFCPEAQAGVAWRLARPCVRVSEYRTAVDILKGDRLKNECRNS